jgi:hypothetical protein
MKPWEVFGLSRSTYLWRIKHGRDVTARPHEGSGRYPAPRRFSGKDYENPPEKIETIRQKYANGVPAGEVENWINSL